MFLAFFSFISLSKKRESLGRYCSVSRHALIKQKHAVAQLAAEAATQAEELDKEVAGGICIYQCRTTNS